MSGTLFVVATPIGNLEDVTLRALRVLREADIIAAEDTRRTAKLLAHHGISTPTLSFHAHNSRQRIPQLTARLAAGAQVALVTDAGTPGISDPGAELVAACVAAGIAVDPIPGASAPLAAVMASGFATNRITILGFPPRRGAARAAWFSGLAQVSGTVTFFEAPHRLRATLAEASGVLGERQICVGRELTKLHQEFVRGTLQQVIDLLPAPIGEFTIVVAPMEESASLKTLPDDQELAAEFGQMSERGHRGRREAVSAMARRYGRSAREIYAAIERGKLFGQTTE